MRLRDMAAAHRLRKRQSLEKARLRYGESNRTAKYAACAIIAAASFAASAICVSVLMQLYAAYKYETALNTLSLPEIEKPCYILIDIEYQDSPPRNVKLARENLVIPSEKLDISDDPAKKILTIGFDTDRPSDGYELRIEPADNLELEYKISLEPSYKYIISSAEAYGDPHGDMWLNLNCSFARQPGELRCVINSRGNTYGCLLAELSLPQDEDIPVNISGLMRQAQADESRLSQIYITFSAKNNEDGAEGEGWLAESAAHTIDLAAWPAYDPEGGYSYDSAEIKKYIIEKEEGADG